MAKFNTLTLREQNCELSTACNECNAKLFTPFFFGVVLLGALRKLQATRHAFANLRFGTTCKTFSLPKLRGWVSRVYHFEGNFEETTSLEDPSVETGATWHVSCLVKNLVSKKPLVFDRPRGAKKTNADKRG